MANPVNGEIILTIAVTTRSEASYKAAVALLSDAIVKSAFTAEKKLPNGSDITDAKVVVTNVTSLKEPKTPEMVVPNNNGESTAAVTSTRKPVSKQAKKRKAVSKKAPAKRGAAAKRVATKRAATTGTRISPRTGKPVRPYKKKTAVKKSVKRRPIRRC